MRLREGLKLREIRRRYMIVRSLEGSVDFSEIISLNETSAYVWKRASTVSGFEETDMVKWLLEEYEVDEATAAADVHETITTWKKYGLID